MDLSVTNGEVYSQHIGDFPVTLIDINIAQAYDTGDREGHVVRDFYVPVLQESISYKRLTGYFSSQVLALAARGIAGLIKNGGKMQLITSPVVSEVDFEALTSSAPEDIQKFVDAQFTKAIGDLNDLASTIAYDHVRALGWMLREGILEIRVLIPREINSGAGIFHSKVGIVEDSEGNKVSFSGSVNETAMGWSQNIEEFKVFKSWEAGSAFWVEHDEALFEKYWACSSDDGFQAIPLPRDSTEKLMSIAPEEIEELNLVIPSSANERKLRQYQLDAINSWEQAGFRGILEMATGTGKTFTARECIKRWKNGKSNSVVLIIAPTQTIGSQWLEVLTDMKPVTTFGSKHWKESIRNLSAQAALGVIEHIVVIAIQNTACSADFIEAFSKLMKFSENHLIIADEMHGLGAPMFRNALNPTMEARLGLTATPNRWFDEEGTELLNQYFNGVVFTFGLHEALTWVDPETGLTPLCPYNYYPEFVTLDALEMDEYLDLTKRIIMQSNKATDIDGQEKLNRLLEKRASVLKKAHGKFSALTKVLDKLEKILGCLVYCSDREQINEVIELIASRGITYRTFTGEEGTSPRKEFNGKSERDWILQSFEDGDIQMLIAMKCLDEGVDIPSAQIGVILASTTNPREFIQRRGRLLRRAKGKQIANIYDMIVSPEFDSDDQSDVVTSARKIMAKELMRADEFAKDAVNSIDVSGKVLGRMLIMGDHK
jgi:superfamily II DNA or RNA helicase